MEIALLGAFAVRESGGQPIELPGRKDCALLAFLAASAGVACHRERLADLLWGGSGERQARESLKQALLRLRRALGAATAAPLIADRQSVAIDRARVSVDVGRFEGLVGEGTTESLDRAVALYRGDLLDGVTVREPAFEDWLQVERQRLRQLAVDAATLLMTRCLASGRRDRAASAARRLLSLEPLHEGACRTLMQVHVDRGERALALKLFESLRDRLQRELGALPDAETAELYQTIRARRELPAPEGLVLGALATVPANGLSMVTEARCPTAPSITVLPFTNIGDDSRQDCFADGLTEDIITDLSRISALIVVARHAAFAFKGRAVPVLEVARVLNVSHVLEGRVRKAAGRVRITAQLIDGVSGGHVWAGRYDRDFDDIFAVQDEITGSIVDALKVRLLPEEQRAPTGHGSKNADAYRYYLMGRSFYRRGIDQHGLRIARGMFAKAVEIDPGYARAHAAIAICASYLAMGDPDATYEDYRLHSRRAQELAPNAVETFLLRGLTFYAEGRYLEAAPEFERALKQDPDSADACFFYARGCRLLGRHGQAAMLFGRAAQLRPTDSRSLGLQAKSYKALGRPREAMAAARQCLERLEAEIAAHPDNAGALAFGSAVLAELGQRSRAEDWAARAMMISPDDRVACYSVARAYAILGEPEIALDWLERAFTSSATWRRRLGSWMRADEDMEPLRDRPRFRALVRGLSGGWDGTSPRVFACAPSGRSPGGRGTPRRRSAGRPTPGLTRHRVLG